MDLNGFQDSQPYSQSVFLSFAITCFSLRKESSTTQVAVNYFLIDGLFEVVWLFTCWIYFAPHSDLNTVGPLFLLHFPFKS